MNILYPILAAIVVSLISVIVALPLLLKKQIPKKSLLFLLSMSIGVIMATIFMDFLPEVTSHGYPLSLALTILGGFLVMFLIEKLIHYHHNKKCESNDHGHSHGFSLAPINLIGDGIHNFIDGLVIAGSFAINPAVGISATLSIIFHEVPQEIADFGVLLYSGMSRKKALLFNLLSALTSVVGVILGIYLISKFSGFNDFIIPFAIGNFLYIAASNLLPQLHRHCGLKDSFLHILAIILGIALITVITLFGPAHGHF